MYLLIGNVYKTNYLYWLVMILLVIGLKHSVKFTFKNHGLSYSSFSSPLSRRIVIIIFIITIIMLQCSFFVPTSQSIYIYILSQILDCIYDKDNLWQIVVSWNILIPCLMSYNVYFRILQTNILFFFFPPSTIKNI